MAHRYLLRPVRTLRRTISTPTDSHSDFARLVKPAPAASARERIQNHLSESKVVLYMKGLPSSPACGFSWRTVQVLNAMGVQYRAHNVLVDDALRQGIKEFAEWPTIPQVYVDGEFVGGADIVEGMARSGELKKLLTEKGVLDAVQQRKQGKEV